jgi:hypothetical protein
MRNIVTALFLLVALSAFSYFPAPPKRYFQQDEKWYFGNKTDNGVVYGIEIIGADVGSFRSVCHSRYLDACEITEFAKDNNYAYYLGQRIESANPQTFELIRLMWKNLYSRDDKNVFFMTEKVEGADRETFEDISIVNRSTFGRDKNFIYRGAVRMPYDIATFRELRAQGFTIDKLGVYYRDTLLAGSCFNDFRELETYIISNNRVFFKDRELKDADADSFQIIEHIAGWFGIEYSIARDKNHIYVDNQKLTEIDVETVVISDVGHWRGTIVQDKNGTFRLKEDYDNRGFFNLIPIEIETEMDNFP